MGTASAIFATLARTHLAWIAFGLLAILGGCATRAPHPDGLQTQANLPDRTAHRLILVWEQQLSQYISVEGDGDPAVLFGHGFSIPETCDVQRASPSMRWMSTLQSLVGMDGTWKDF